MTSKPARASAAPSFKRYKEDVKKRGKPFFPYAMFHDTVMSLVVVVRDHRARRASGSGRSRATHGTDAGLARPALHATRPTPARSSFVPRPDWYFYFLFYLLRIFKWPDSVILGTVGIPTICLVLLLALPFLDMRRERRLLRRPGRGRRRDPRRPLDGRADLQGRDREGVARRARPIGAVPSWVKKHGFADERRCRARSSSRRPGCLTCHTYLGSGLVEPRRARPDRRGREEQGHRVPDRPPEVPELREPGLADAAVRVARRRATSRKLAIFLEASKGAEVVPPTGRVCASFSA